MRFYIASKLENHKAHNELRDRLTALGHTITYDWTIHGPVWQEGIDRCEEVAENEVDGVLQAKMVIILMPGGRGTHVELGIALGSVYDPRIILIGDESQYHESVEGTCAFYHHPRVEKFRDVDSFLEWLNENRKPSEIRLEILKKLSDKISLTFKDAETLGYEADKIWNILSFPTLPDEVQQLIRDDMLTLAAAFCLTKVQLNETLIAQAVTMDTASFVDLCKKIRESNKKERLDV